MNFIKKNEYISVFLAVLVLISVVYSSFLHNQFAVIDDLAGFVQNESIRNFSASIFTLHLTPIIFSLFYNLWGINPLPFRIFAIFTHALVSLLLYILTSKFYSKKIAFSTTLIFALHPVNTEVLNWLSANWYMWNALFMFSTLIFYTKYKQEKLIKYFYWSFILFCLDLVFIRHPWSLVIPIALFCLDQFFIENRINIKKSQILLYFIIPLVPFYFLHFASGYADRVSNRVEGGESMLLNEQKIIPIVESYPYTIYNLERLYVFPKDLTIYYDGNKITVITKWSMYIGFLIYVGSVIYFYKKNKKIAGLLLLLVVFISPTLSPKKITWFITERYLYNGAGFFSLLLSLLLFYISKKIKIKNIFWILLTFLLCVYSYRIFLRNKDWNNPKTFALATIKISPLSIRPYNDIGGAYAMEKNYSKAQEYYNKALQIGPSLTAMNNLGFIYFELGVPAVLDDSFKLETPDLKKSENFYARGVELIKIKQYRQALYDFNESLKYNFENVSSLYAIGDLYLQNNQYDFAKKVFERILEINKNSEHANYSLGYIHYKQGDIEKAKYYLQETLKINPNNKDAKKNLQVIFGSL